MKRALALMLSTCLLAGGCSTTFTTLSLDRRQLKLQVTSETPGAVVLLDGKTVGQTPAEITVPFQHKAERINSGKYKAGWAVLGAGLGMVAGAVAMTAGGATLIRDADPDKGGGQEAGGYVLAVFGVGLGLTGLASLGVGAVNIATSEASRERTLVEPPTAVVEVRVAGKKPSVRFALSPRWPRPRLSEIGRMHVFDGRAVVRPCTITVPVGETESIISTVKGAPAPPQGQAFVMPCQVRRLTPLVGHYDRQGKPLYRALYAMRFGKDGGWLEKLQLPLTLETGGKKLERKVVLEAAKVWQGTEVQVTVQPDVKIEYK